MAEELINALARVPGLHVPARTSSFAYKGRNTDVRQIARDLGVAAVLEGSVRSADERIRVTAQLIDARSGFHLWSQSYDREFSDLFKLQDELSAAIVQVINVKMNGSLGSAAAGQSPTHDLAAYESCLQAVALTKRPYPDKRNPRNLVRSEATGAAVHAECQQTCRIKRERKRIARAARRNRCAQQATCQP